MSRIVVLGSGAWGTAIALSLHRRGGHQITLWSFSQQEAQHIADARENVFFFPAFHFPLKSLLPQKPRPSRMLKLSSLSFRPAFCALRLRD